MVTPCALGVSMGVFGAHPCGRDGRAQGKQSIQTPSYKVIKTIRMMKLYVIGTGEGERGGITATGRVLSVGRHWATARGPRARSDDMPHNPSIALPKCQKQLLPGSWAQISEECMGDMPSILPSLRSQQPLF